MPYRFIHTNSLHFSDRKQECVWTTALTFRKMLDHVFYLLLIESGLEVTAVQID